jgi:beta-1,2-mannobiose phosphorylase / 1,2-beta-oligomannan phosphorylase
MRMLRRVSERITRILHGMSAVPHAERGEPGLRAVDVNPILTPDPRRPWESKAVFNPAAVEIDDRVHLLYRAIGRDDRSALGYASSESGVSFTRPLDEPAYVAREPFEGNPHRIRGTTPGPYVSGGGGWGGVEDPRITRVGERLYMTYVAYNGFDPPRVALTSIDAEDFRAQRWKWERPVLISRPGIVNKNAVLFPEKVRGKYVMLHRVYPNILLDYLDDLDFDGETKWLTGQHAIPPSADGWDSHKVGAGPPPLKTRYGWLLICQGVGKDDGYRYKIGAMLLDEQHPENVIARPREPILEPNEWYTNQGWKSGVVYPCGAVVKGGRLFVYYGGADTYVCVATAPFDDFMRDLARERRPSMSIFPIRWLVRPHPPLWKRPRQPRWASRRRVRDATV